MARYKVQGPDGKVYVFEGPEGATPAEVEAFAAQHFGQTKTSRLAAERERVRAEDAKRYNPTEGMSTGDKLAAGAGSGLASVLRAVGAGGVLRAMGLPDTKEEADALDKPLADTTAGAIGRVVGQAAPAALAIPFTPVAAGAAGNAAIGAGVGAATGAVLTEGDAGDRAAGALGGGLGGAVAPLVAPATRVVRGAWRGLTEPFTAAGRDRIAGRTIQRFATNPDALETLAGGPTVTGARPTLAEATRDPGLATLQRAVATVDPDAAASLAARLEANNAARVQTLEALAGRGEAPVQSSVRRLRQIQQGPSRDAATATRSAQAREAYGEAFAQGIDQDAAAAVQPMLEELLGRPSIQRSIAAARNLAREEGLTIDDAGSVAGLHYLKTALDSRIGKLSRAGASDREVALVRETAANLSSVLDEIAPAYQTARAAYRQLSVPVNRQDVAARLAERALSDTRDLSGNRTLRAGQFARSLNDEADLISKATGFDGAGNTLDDFLTATQSGRIGAVRNELETLAALDRAANGPGSQTAKMLASQNLLRQVAGPMGLPESWLEGVAAETFMRPIAWGARAAEERVAGRVADAMLEPSAASALVRGAQVFDTPRAISPLEQQLRLLLSRGAPGAAGALGAYGAGQ